MGHHNHSIQWQHNHSTIRWRIRGNLQTIATTWRGWRNSPFACAAGWESLIILMRGWQRRDQRPRHVPNHLWDKRRLALRPRDTWKPGFVCVSVNSFVATRWNEQVSNWSWLRRQGRADARDVVGNFSLLWALVWFSVCVPTVWLHLYTCAL